MFSRSIEPQNWKELLKFSSVQSLHFMIFRNIELDINDILSIEILVLLELSDQAFLLLNMLIESVSIAWRFRIRQCTVGRCLGYSRTCSRPCSASRTWCNLAHTSASRGCGCGRSCSGRRRTCRSCRSGSSTCSFCPAEACCGPGWSPAGKQYTPVTLDARWTPARNKK